MFCNDMIFDNKLLSDYGLMICSFDGSTPTKSGGEVTFITSKPPGSDTHTFYASQSETPISMTFSIGKNDCETDDYYFSQDEQSAIYRWLVRKDGFHWLAFDQEGFEDVWFNAQINLQEVFSSGRVVGYDVTVSTDSPNAFSQEFKKSFTLNSNESFIVKNYSDIPGDIYPEVTITPKDNGNVILESGCCDYKKITTITHANNSTNIILDGKNDYYSGVNDPDFFNYVFPVMGNSFNDIDTYFTNKGSISLDIAIKYRFIRRCAI